MQRFRFGVAEFFFACRVSTGATCFALLVAARRTVAIHAKFVRFIAFPFFFASFLVLSAPTIFQAPFASWDFFTATETRAKPKTICRI